MFGDFISKRGDRWGFDYSKFSIIGRHSQGDSVVY